MSDLIDRVKELRSRVVVMKAKMPEESHAERLCDVAQDEVEEAGRCVHAEEIESAHRHMDRAVAALEGVSAMVEDDD